MIVAVQRIDEDHKRPQKYLTYKGLLTSISMVYLGTNMKELTEFAEEWARKLTNLTGENWEEFTEEHQHNVLGLLEEMLETWQQENENEEWWPE